MESCSHVNIVKTGKIPEKSNKCCIITPAVSVHIPKLQSNVLESIPDCQPAAKVGKDPLLHQELVNDGEDKTDEDKEHEGDSDGEDDEGDLFCKVEDHSCCITGGHRGSMQQQGDCPVAEGLCNHQARFIYHAHVFEASIRPGVLPT